MLRIVVLLILGVALVWLLRRLFSDKDERPRDGALAKGEDMVACAQCGVNLPRSDARLQDGRYFCRDNPRCTPSP